MGDSKKATSDRTEAEEKDPIHLDSRVCNILNSSILRMSHVNRYSSIPVTRYEKVSEHSWYTAFYSYLLGRMIESKRKVDFGVLLSRALVHDIDESRMGDFLRGVKYGDPRLKNILDELSARVVQYMSDEFGVDILPDWTSAKAEDLEGDIVSLADLLCVASYIDEQLMFGNRHIYPRLTECKGYIKKLEETVCDDVKPFVRSAVRWISARVSAHSSRQL